MSESSRRKQAVAWQDKWMTPILVVVAIVVAIGAAAAGGIPWWLGAIIGAFGVLTLGTLVRRRTTPHSAAEAGSRAAP